MAPRVFCVIAKGYTWISDHLINQYSAALWEGKNFYYFNWILSVGWTIVYNKSSIDSRDMGLRRLQPASPTNLIFPGFTFSIDLKLLRSLLFQNISNHMCYVDFPWYKGTNIRTFGLFKHLKHCISQNRTYPIRSALPQMVIWSRLVLSSPLPLIRQSNRLLRCQSILKTRRVQMSTRNSAFSAMKKSANNK